MVKSPAQIKCNTGTMLCLLNYISAMGPTRLDKRKQTDNCVNPSGGHTKIIVTSLRTVTEAMWIAHPMYCLKNADIVTKECGFNQSETIYRVCVT